MVRRYSIILLVILFLIGLQSCSRKSDSIPRFWTWIHSNNDNTIDDWNRMFSELDELGIRGILIGADKEQLTRIIPIADKYNVEVHAWMWTMNRGDAPKELLSVNALGKSLADEKAYVDYYKFMCPALPETHDFIRSKISELGSIEGLSGVHMDYIRYVDVFLPLGLLPKYDLIQDSIMPEFDYGYHKYMLDEYEESYGVNPYDIPDYANDESWQQFRMDKVTEVANKVAALPQFEDMIISSAVFPDPVMSRKMVRQDWAKWNLDYFFPMVYYNFYNEDVEWVEEIVRNSRQILPKSKIFCGLYVPEISDDITLTKGIENAFNGGATGISFFDYRALKSIHKIAIKEATNKYGEYLD